MKTSSLPLLATSLLSLLSAGHSGETKPANDKNPIAHVPEALQEPKKWKFTLNSRARWEFGDQDGRDESNAYTLRNRAGLLLGPFEGLSLFAEYEGTLTADRDSYQAASVHGLGQNKTIIADPESHELNQLWVDYKRWDTDVKIGRQRIVLNNARFVGDVAWRQNSQTFDAATITNTSVDNLTLFYGYIHRVERIFGSGNIHAAAQEDFEGNSHLGNIAYHFAPELTLTGYSYFLDLNNSAGNDASNNTYGLQAKGTLPAGNLSVPYLLEGAYQTDGADSQLNYGAWYFHANAGAKIAKVTVGAGFEHLGSDSGKGFQTPLATLHAFNGWADKFLVTPTGGLSDAYIFCNASLLENLQLKSQFHWFGPDSGSLDYGTEVDAALVYAFHENFTVGAKFAQYFADEFATDTTRFTLDFVFNF